MFCSRECGTKARTSDMESRFWPKVNKTDTCWLWTGANLGGKWPYGVLFSEWGKSAKKAHHISWEIHKGPVPKGLWVLHKCDVPQCVNPDHLFVGTAAENTTDMVQKGRAKGGRPEGSSLSPESLESFRQKRGWAKTPPNRTDYHREYKRRQRSK